MNSYLFDLFHEVIYNYNVFFCFLNDVNILKYREFNIKSKYIYFYNQERNYF